MTQSLHPAQHGRIPAVLPRPKLERLHKLADQHLSLPGQRPLRLADQFALGSSPRERYRAAGFQAMLSAAKPWLEATLGPRWLVLAGKVLLRHTWPLAEEMA